MVRITKNGRELYIPFSAYVQDYKDIGWEIVKKPQPKKETIKEEVGQQIKSEEKTFKVEPVEKQEKAEKAEAPKNYRKGGKK